MTGMGKYKISDLVKETGVARTTINDWLQRYSQYLTYEIRGKRKLYTDHALKVLREIAGLRNADRNSFEIEAALAANYPVRPEIAAEPHLAGDGNEPAASDAVDTVNASEAPMASDVPGAVAAGDREFALIAKKQTDEIARLIGEQLCRLNARLETIEQSGRQARRNNLVWATVFILLVVMAAILGRDFFRRYEERSRDLRSLAEQQHRTALDLEQRKHDLEEKQRQLRQLTTTLDRNDREYEKNMRQLRSDLTRQRKDFENSLRQAGAKAANREQLLRDNGAAEKLAMLQQLYRVAEQDGTNNPASGPQSHKRLLQELERLRHQLVPTAATTKTVPPRPGAAAAVKTAPAQPAAAKTKTAPARPSAPAPKASSPAPTANSGEENGK
ncbi:MAG: MerR family transcriptional regulator [Victivallales bacterium]|nr:MerR family transcriptional regulator [Victivallales bacterium]